LIDPDNKGGSFIIFSYVAGGSVVGVVVEFGVVKI